MMDEDIETWRERLRLFEFKQVILNELSKNKTLILASEIGLSKSTQIPQYVLEAGLAKNKCIAVTQPRRLAATTIAKRVAQEVKTKLGYKVGYSTRFENLTSPSTKIKFVTDGMLVKEAIADKLLLQYSVIILDEADERTLLNDLLLVVTKYAQHIRQERNMMPLKIIVMSSTFKVQHIIDYFKSASKLFIRGQEYRISILTAEKPEPDYISFVLFAIFHIHKEAKGDILVFCTCQEEIRYLLYKVAKDLPSDCDKIHACGLYSALPFDQQTDVFNPAPVGVRKIIFATNIAETSTIPNIKYVIDIGLVKTKSYDAKSDSYKFSLKKISKVQAEQRAFRVGRGRDGACYRLYTVDEFSNFKDETELRSNLSNDVLLMLFLGFDNISEFDFIDQPYNQNVDAAVESIESLEVVVEKSRNLENVDAAIESIESLEVVVEKSGNFENVDAAIESIESLEVVVEKSGNFENVDAAIESIESLEVVVEKSGNFENVDAAIESIESLEVVVEKSGNFENVDAAIESIESLEVVVEKSGNFENVDAAVESIESLEVVVEKSGNLENVDAAIESIESLEVVVEKSGNLENVDAAVESIESLEVVVEKSGNLENVDAAVESIESLEVVVEKSGNLENVDAAVESIESLEVVVEKSGNLENTVAAVDTLKTLEIIIQTSGALEKLHLQRAISAQQAYRHTGALVIPTPDVVNVPKHIKDELYPATYKCPQKLIQVHSFSMDEDIPDYDMDSEDETWFSQQAESLDIRPLQYEEIMDRLEKSSGQHLITLKEAKLLLNYDNTIIIAVYDYWKNKRLKTQHPLIPQVRTEKLNGSTNKDPYLAFRKRTEKMQTRQDRKNNESSYENILKLRREFGSIVNMMELVKQREKTKRDMLQLTVDTIEKSYQAQDFSDQMPTEVSAKKRPRQSSISVNSRQVVIKQETQVTKSKPIKSAPAKTRQYKRKNPQSSSKSALTNSLHGLDVNMGDLACSDEDTLSMKRIKANSPPPLDCDDTKSAGESGSQSQEIGRRAPGK